MSDHLLMDHGDCMALANSVEARYPFLDVRFAELATCIPPHLKLNGSTEKYILRKMAQSLLPPEVLRREKFGWFAPGSPELLQQGTEWIHDMLAPERIRRQGYFDVDAIEYLKSRYSQEGFRLNFPYDEDFLMIVATFGLFLDTFSMPDLV
jgi:asparagine synthase (glutamine-hydrolysing)